MPSLLPSEENRYKGRWVTTDLPRNTVNFDINLAHSLDTWFADGTKIVWLTIDASRASLISVAITYDFSFHHTREDCVVMTKTLIANAIFPGFANHTLGVGGIVFNDRNEILTVVEKHDMIDRPGHWKFPGGAVDNGELIRDAAVREVREETGVIARLVNMVGLRHYHHGQFGTSNMYVICRLQAMSDVITPCPDEIGMAKWFDVEEYLACDTVIEFNKALLRSALDCQGLPDVDLGELHGIPVKEYEIFA